MPKSPPHRSSPRCSPPRRRTTPSTRYLEDIIHLDPLFGTYKGLFDKYGGEMAELTNALNQLRLKLIETIHVPLGTVCDLLPPAPDSEIKVAVLRHYIREHNLYTHDGRTRASRGGFWENIDDLYDGLIEMFGNAFDSYGWTDYMQAIIEEDEAFASCPAAELEVPLFTYTPLVMKVFHILN
ncbi:hypothetical protein MVEN_00825900 [Mycena venus]|uniref:Uncharacterized protein n=1 Tax=Mycena venus TaxID=2733690 RepID=A0A8H6YGF5_9AGAR|nr:hypothetical protein MVEN_00825900 [Mycena venus]